jgi:hypothetical protein
VGRRFVTFTSTYGAALKAGLTSGECAMQLQVNMDRGDAIAYYKAAPFNLDDAGAGGAADAMEAT